MRVKDLRKNEFYKTSYWNNKIVRVMRYLGPTYKHGYKQHEFIDLDNNIYEFYCRSVYRCIKRPLNNKEAEKIMAKAL